MKNMKMLDYDRFNVLEGIDVNEASYSKECDLSHYWYFLNKGFKLEPIVSNGCNDLLMISMNLNDVAIWNSKSNNHCCIISGISKSEAINPMPNIDLTKKVEHCKT